MPLPGDVADAETVAAVVDGAVDALSAIGILAKVAHRHVRRGLLLDMGEADLADPARRVTTLAFLRFACSGGPMTSGGRPSSWPGRPPS